MSRSIVIALVLLTSCRASPSRAPEQAAEPEHATSSVEPEPSEAIVYERHPLPPPPPPPLAWVSLHTLAVSPHEFSSMVRNHSTDEKELSRCVLPQHPERTTDKGELQLAYVIGPVARVVSVTLERCDFSDAEICECFADHVTRWRFPPHVQNVQVQLRVRTRPGR